MLVTTGKEGMRHCASTILSVSWFRLSAGPKYNELNRVQPHALHSVRPSFPFKFSSSTNPTLRFPDTWPVYSPSQKVCLDITCTITLYRLPWSAGRLAGVVRPFFRVERLDILSSNISDERPQDPKVQCGCPARKWPREDTSSSSCCVCGRIDVWNPHSAWISRKGEIFSKCCKASSNTLERQTSKVAWSTLLSIKRLEITSERRLL